MSPLQERLRRLLAPSSVAVVGATDRPGSYGGHVLRNLERNGFAGPVVGVHPTRREVLGRRCVPSLDALDAPVDAVVVATPAGSVPEVVDAAGRLGCGGAVVLAAGFGEARADAGGARLQDALVAAAARHGLPVIGPNGNGIVAVPSRAALWGDAVVLADTPGRVALLTQSGNIGVLALAHRRGLALHSVVSLGNSAVTDAAQVLEQLAGTDGIRCVAAYLEDDGDGPRLAAALARCAEADVRVVVLKAGRSDRGRAAGAAHTAALAGNQAAFAALVEAAGGVLVHAPHDLFETAAALAAHRRRAGALAVVTSSGGDAAVAADLAADAGVPLATLGPATMRTLEGLLPPTATPGNPLDHTNHVWADTAAVTRICEAVASDPSVGHLFYVQDEPPGLPVEDAREWAATRAGGLFGGAAAGVPTLVVATTPGLEPDGAVGGLSAALACVRALRRPAPDPARLRAVAAAARRVTVRRPGAWLAEPDAKALLAGAGIAVPPGRTIRWGNRARDPAGTAGGAIHEATETATETAVEAAVEAAVDAAGVLGGGVALKLCWPGLLHKADAGALALDLRDAAAVREAASRLVGLADALGRDDAVLLVEAMVAAGPELLVGVSAGDVVPTLTVGVGGRWTEVVRDVATLPLPVDAADVLAAMRGLRGAGLLADAGEEALAHGARAAAAVADLVLREPLTLVELNPLVLNGSGAWAVDAVVRAAATDPAPVSGRPEGASLS